MKINFTKNLLILLVLAFATSVNAQVYIWGGPDATGTEFDNSTFNGGLNDWTTIGLECLNADSVANAVWYWHEDVDLGGAYYNPVQNIDSPTKANGSVSFDSDFLDNAGVAGNFGAGAAPAPQVSALISPALDFSSNAGVALTFYESYRNFYSKTQVEVSVDGGSTWTIVAIPLNDVVAPNDATDNNAQVTLDISSYVANQSDVRVRFVWTHSDTNDSGYYFWTIDDVAFVEPPAPDLAVSEIWVPAASYSQPQLTGVACDVMQFRCRAASLTGAIVDALAQVDVISPAGDVLFTATETVVVGDPSLDTKDTVTFADQWAPVNEIGEYTVKYSLVFAEDTVLANNSQSGTFIVSDSGWFTKGEGAVWYPFNNAKDIYSQGVFYSTCDFGDLDIMVDSVTFSVSNVGLGNDFVGEKVTLYVKKVLNDDQYFPGSGELSISFNEKDVAGDWEAVANADYEFASVDDSEVTLNITQLYNNLEDEIDVFLDASSMYVFALVNPGFTPDVTAPEKGIAYGNNADMHAYGGGGFLIIDGSSYGGWSGSGPADIHVKVKLVSGTNTPKLAENSLVIIQNPVQDELRLEMNFDKATKVGFAVASMNGSIIDMGSWDNVLNNKETLNVSGLANGQYLIRIQTAEGMITKTFTVVK